MGLKTATTAVICSFVSLVICRVNQIDCEVVSGESDILIIGPRIIRPSHPKVFVYSRKNVDPSDQLQFNEIDSSEVSSNEENVICEKMKDVSNFYECTMDKEFFDASKSYQISSSLDFFDEDGTSIEMDQSMIISTKEPEFSTMIQTDKPRYKPGDTVKMRIFFINQDYTAASENEIRNFHVEIKNNYDEIIYDFSEREFESKVYTLTYNIGEEPFEGDYKIHVWTNVEDDDDSDDRFEPFEGPFNDDESTIQGFRVEKYILSEFKINIDTQRIVRPYSTIVLKISGEYSFGKSVYGRLSLLAKVENNGGVSNTYNVSDVIGIDGGALKTIYIETDNDLGLNNKIRNYDVSITIIFTDDFLRQSVVKTVKVTVAEVDDVSLVLKPVESSFKPGTTFMMNVQLRDIDGYLIESTKQPVFLDVKQTFLDADCRNSSKLVRLGNKVFKDSVATFEVDVPQSMIFMEFEATYDNGKFKGKLIVLRTKDATVTENYVNIKPVKSIYEATPGKVSNIEYRIQSNYAFYGPEEVFYVIFIGEHGDMKVKMEKRNKKDDFKYSTQIESWMVPAVNVIILAHSEAGEFVFDATKVKITPQFTNSMSIDIQGSPEVKPGDDIKMEFSVNNLNDETSTLHLLSVDERVRYFGNDNDITKEKILRTTAQLFENVDFFNVSGKIDDQYDILSKFNAFVMTNTNAEEKRCKINLKDYNLDLSGNQQPSPGDETQDFLRKDFPETFIFADIHGSQFSHFADNKFTIKATTPHSISSFFINGFVFHPIHGLGIAKEEKKFTIFKDFFAKVLLPQTIHMEEVLKMNVVVFNYVKNSQKPVDASITVEIVEMMDDDDDEYPAECGFVDVAIRDKTYIFTPLDGEQMTKNVEVDNGGSNSADFFIQATTTGKVTFKITASTKGKTDTMLRTLTIVPHGRRVTQNTGFFVDLRQTNYTENSFMCYFPDADYVVKKTQKVFATAYGNTMGQVLTGVDTLIAKPTGCPEQTFTKWISNVIAFNYLSANDQLNDTLRNTLVSNIKIGYDRLAITSRDFIDSDAYRGLWESYENRIQTEGAFNLMSYNDKTGTNTGYSTWNSAYYAQLMNACKDAITIDVRDIKGLLDYIKTLQNSTDGSFHDYVHISYFSSTTAATKVPLTAFAMMAFLYQEDNEGLDEDYEDNVDEGFKYLTSQTSSMEAYFDMATTAYALSLLPNGYRKYSGYKRTLSEILNTMANETVKSSNMMYWTNKRGDIPTSEVTAVQIETASYALLAMSKYQEKNDNKDHMESILKVMNWLLTVKNSNGGYKSSHDTVVAIMALSEASKMFLRINTDLDIDFERMINFNIQEANANDVQQKRLHKIIDQVQMDAEGRGIAFAGVTCEYFEKAVDSGENYELNVGVELSDHQQVITVYVETRAVDKPGADVRGMSLVEVELPSGFEFRNDEEIFKDLSRFGVKKVEFINERSVAVLYFDPLSEKTQSFNVKGYRVFDVYELKSASVRVYSYSSSETNNAIVYYNPKWATD